MALTDTDRMPFGRYKNEKMANVPANYLLWLYDEYTNPNQKKYSVNEDVKAYIEDNMDILNQEVKNKQKK